MQKTILHLDMNSYFATCEQQANPTLRGRPVGIVKAAGRGCIIAASVEAKKFGVKTGSTVWEAQKLCPQIILVPSDMDKYFALTQKLMTIARDYSPDIEIFSIDEFFLDVTQSQLIYPGGVMQIAWELKARIRESLGEWMKASVGISYSKLLAKLASEMNKPDGLVVLTPENYLTATCHMPVGEVCGIGYARTKYLHSRGAFTLGQARQLELPPEIYELVWLKLEWEMARVEDLDPAKSVSRTFTTFRTLSTQDSVLKLVRNLVEEACSKLREMKMAGRTMGLSLREQEAGAYWQRKTIKTPTDDPLIIYKLLEKDYVASPLPQVRFAGVWISNLVFGNQCSIFSGRDDLLRATDVVNDKYGLFTVYPASLLGGDAIIRPEVTGFLGDKYYRFVNKP